MLQYNTLVATERAGYVLYRALVSWASAHSPCTSFQGSMQQLLHKRMEFWARVKSLVMFKCPWALTWDTTKIPGKLCRGGIETSYTHYNTSTMCLVQLHVHVSYHICSSMYTCRHHPNLGALWDLCNFFFGSNLRRLSKHQLFLGGAYLIGTYYHVWYHTVPSIDLSS